MDDHRLGFAAQGDLACGLEVETMPRQRMGGGRDQDGPGLRCTKKPGGGIDRVAGHIIGGTRTVTQAARHDRPGVYGDIQSHRLAEPCRPPVVQRRTAAQHVERRFEGTLRIVLGSDRRAEQGKDGVAKVFGDKAAITGNGLAKRLE